MSAAIAPNAPAVTAAPPDPLAGTGLFLGVLRYTSLALLALAVYYGGPALKLAGVSAIVLGFFAERTGAFQHVLHLAWLPIAAFLASVFGVPLGQQIAQTAGLPLPVAVVIGVAVVIIAGLIVSGLFGRGVTRVLRKHRYLYVLNRAGGLALGVAEGGLLAAVLIWVLAVFGPAIWLWAVALEQGQPEVARLLHKLDRARAALQADPAGRWVDAHNPIAEMDAVVAVTAMAELAAAPDYFWELVDEGVLDEMLAIPVVRKHFDAIRGDRQLQNAIENRDFRTLLSSTKVARALNDDELCQAVAEFWPRIRARVPDEHVAKAHRLAGRLEGQERRQYNHAMQRAREFGIEPH